jgi:hypothetical protein
MDNWPYPLRDVVEIDLFDLGRILSAATGIRLWLALSRNTK